MGGTHGGGGGSGRRIQERGSDVRIKRECGGRGWNRRLWGKEVVGRWFEEEVEYNGEEEEGRGKRRRMREGSVGGSKGAGVGGRMGT